MNNKNKKRTTSQFQMLVAGAIHDRIIDHRDIRMLVSTAELFSQLAARDPRLALRVDQAAKTLARELEACRAGTGARWSAERSELMRLLPLVP